MLTIGSLFTGYGGLDLAAETVLDARTVWTSDIDPGASRIIAARFPHAPNLGDITAVDWSAVPAVDIVTGGFPCQDVSHAGARKGLGLGTRTGLWSRMADAINHLRPALVVAENVRGLLSARAFSDVEPCPWCLGGASDGEPALRALGSVLGDLADLGYDAAWYGLRASDVGAPHGRFRVFILAWPADAKSRHGTVQSTGDGGCTAVDGTEPRAGTRAGTRRTPTGIRVVGGGAGLVGEDAADTGEPGREGPEPARRQLVPARGGTPDTEGFGRRWERVPGPGDGATKDGRRPASPRGRPRATPDTEDASEPTAWGPYEPAIRRWEQTLGRFAPAPTERAPRGGQRLSPRFVEWLMGLPEGWVTFVPDLSRNHQLKALGNGVVPQQAAAALCILHAWKATTVGKPVADLEGA